MKFRILIGIVVLLVVPALIAAFTIVRYGSDRGGSEGIPAHAPRPPAHAPIVGDRVTLEEAQQRTSYTIPVPPADVVGSDIQEVWASKTHIAAEHKKVYIIYANGLRISLGGHPDAPPPADLSELPDTFREVSVGGKTGTGKNAFVNTTSIGTQVDVPASVRWWDNSVSIVLYHPSMTMQELIRIGESMPAPTWPSS